MNRAPQLLCVAMLTLGTHVPSALHAQDHRSPPSPTATDTAEVRRLNAEAWALRRTDPKGAIAMGQHALDLARQIGYRAGEAQALNYIGVAFQWRGEHRVASRYFFDALAVADSAGVEIEQGYALNNIASLHLLDGDGANALTYATRALALQTRVGDRTGIAYATSRLSEVERALHRDADAATHARLAYGIWMALGDSATAATALRNEALAFEGQGRYPDAIAELIRAVDAPTTPMLTRMHILGDLARLALKLHRPDQAIGYAQRKIAGGDEDAETMRYLAEAYAAKGEWPAAYRAATRGAAIQDSVDRIRRSEQLNDLETLYQTNQRQAENVALRRQLRLSRSLVASTGLALLLLAAFGIMLSRSRLQATAASREVEAQLARIQASESALADTLRRQQVILDNVHHGLWVRDLAGRFTIVNGSFTRFFKLPMADILGKTAADILPPELLPTLAAHEARAMTARAPETAEHEFSRDGRRWVLETTITPVYSAEGVLLGTTGIGRDITEQRRAEAALVESERRFRAIFDQTFQFIGLLDLEGRVIEANRTALEFAGIDATTVLGRPFWETPWWSHSPELQDRLKAAIREAAAGDFVRFEASHRGPDGRLRFVDFSLKAVRDAQGKVVLLIPEGRDITERRDAEEENRALQARMLETQKLESLGVLAGGIAHDFNNLLAGILANAEFARSTVRPDSATADALGVIERAALRAGELSRKMLAYSGKTHADRRPFDLSVAIRDIISSFRSSLPPTSALAVDLAADLPPVLGDSRQIQQVVLALLTNAAEALGQTTGIITVGTRFVAAADPLLKALVARGELTPGDYALCEVSDTGAGISPETRAKIFEPFFTTKFTGRGLGLSVCQGVVRGHNGTIQLETDPGRGSRFTIYLPVIGDRRPVPSPRPSGPGRTVAVATPNKPEVLTVLIADDEPEIRKILRTVVERAGFAVVTAEDGVEAVEAVRQRPDAISILILDLVMPRLDGAGAMAQIRRIVPDLPIVISSGFAGEAAEDAALQGDLTAFLEKPYPTSDLLSTMRRLLDERQARRRTQTTS